MSLKLGKSSFGREPIKLLPLTVALCSARFDGIDVFDWNRIPTMHTPDILANAGRGIV